MKKICNNLHSKLAIIKESKNINLDDISKVLSFMKIEKLNIFSINNKCLLNKVNAIFSENGYRVIYTEIKPENFIEFLNCPNTNFLDYNRNSLYIYRNITFLDIKNIFTTINNCCFNVGRGGSQKQHMISPLDLRLSSYLLAMFNFDYKLITYLNTFDYIDINRYISWKDRSNKFKTNLNDNILDK